MKCRAAFISAYFIPRTSSITHHIISYTIILVGPGKIPSAHHGEAQRQRPPFRNRRHGERSARRPTGGRTRPDSFSRDREETFQTRRGRARFQRNEVRLGKDRPMCFFITFQVRGGGANHLARDAVSTVLFYYGVGVPGKLCNQRDGSEKLCRKGGWRGQVGVNMDCMFIKIENLIYPATRLKCEIAVPPCCFIKTRSATTT